MNSIVQPGAVATSGAPSGASIAPPTPDLSVAEEREPAGWELRYNELHAPGQPMEGPWHWECHDHTMATLCGGGEDSITGHIMSVSPCGACSGRAPDKEWKWGRCTTPTEDNARLIAAAPDLLAFAKAHEAWEALLIEAGRWEATGDGLPTFTEEIYDAFMALQGLRNAAVAKAAGQ